MGYFEETDRILMNWAEQIRGTRGEEIARTTVDSIEDLSQLFKLPPQFTGFIDVFRRREGALQTIPRYRDHFLHPFHVFCLGYYILRWCNRKGVSLPIFQETNRDDNLRTWYVMSIYHDVGYPLEQLSTLVENYSEESFGHSMRGQFDWVDVLLSGKCSEHVDGLVEKFAMGCDNDFEKKVKFRKWLHERLLRKNEHGVLGSLMLLSIDWPGREKDMIYEAALAIVLHGWRREHWATEAPAHPLGASTTETLLDPLWMNSYPYALFLSYCDTAQEWGRDVLQGRRSDQLGQISWPRSRLAGIAVEEEEILEGLGVTVTVRVEVRKEEAIYDPTKRALEKERDKFSLTWQTRSMQNLRFVLKFVDANDEDMNLGWTVW